MPLVGHKDTHETHATHSTESEPKHSLGSNLTSRFGLNDNVAEPEDKGTTVVGGGFSERHTADHYIPSTVPGQGRDLEGRGTTGEVFGHRTENVGTGVTDKGATHIGSGAGIGAQTGIGKGATSDGREGERGLAGATAATTAGHTGHIGRTGHTTHTSRTGHGGHVAHAGDCTTECRGQGVTGSMGQSTTGHSTTGTAHRDTNETIPLSGAHHANEHGVPGTRTNELGADAAPQATSHGHHAGAGSAHTGTHRAAGEPHFQNTNNLGPDAKDLKDDAGPRFGL